jgi:hypothetical protein
MTGGARRGGERNLGGGEGAAGPAWAQSGARGGARWAAAGAGPRREGGGRGQAGWAVRAKGGEAAGPKGEEREGREKKRFSFF